MSYGDMPEMVKKEYEIKGTVTISSEEYRDLIEHVSELRVYAEKEHEDYRNECSKRYRLEEEVKKANSKLQELNEWMAEEENARLSFKNWKLAKLAEESEDEE